MHHQIKLQATPGEAAVIGEISLKCLMESFHLKSLERFKWPLDKMDYC